MTTATAPKTETELTGRKGAPAGTAKVDIASIANVYAERFAASLQRHTDKYLAYVEEQKAKQDGAAGLAGPVVPVPSLPLYPWWNLVMAGPFQPIAGPTGPFLPNKIIRAGEPAFMAGVIWRNPAGIDWNPWNPNPITMMSTLTMAVQFQTINLTTGVAGPTFTPVSPNLAPNVLGFVNPIPFWVQLVFPAPQEGAPHLYEVNLVADVQNLGMPFAGYSTWHLDPDREPPFLSHPPMPAGWQHDIPARILVYAA